MKSENKLNWFVADEGDGVLNVFAYVDFDEDGYLQGYEGCEGYHITDFDVVARFRHFEDACRYVENELYNDNKS